MSAVKNSMLTAVHDSHNTHSTVPYNPHPGDCAASTVVHCQMHHVGDQASWKAQHAPLLSCPVLLCRNTQAAHWCHRSCVEQTGSSSIDQSSNSNKPRTTANSHPAQDMKATTVYAAGTAHVTSSTRHGSPVVAAAASTINAMNSSPPSTSTLYSSTLHGHPHTIEAAPTLPADRSRRMCTSPSRTTMRGSRLGACYVLHVVS
ncbi:hypothetical protein COO60DRAFT_491448 [Scenedesmus sp. NREL 46B-D3]|nr:hypothetical protein COO60DRAFT_491448 [Scenedesmus sp. NREL 46B-D3]